MALVRIFSSSFLVSIDKTLLILVELKTAASVTLSCKVNVIGVVLSTDEIGPDRVKPLNWGVDALSNPWSNDTSDFNVSTLFVVSASIVTLLFNVVKLPPKLSFLDPPNEPCIITSDPSSTVKFSLRVIFFEEPTAFMLTGLLSVVKSAPSDIFPLSVIVFDEATALIVISLPCVVKAELVDKFPPNVTDLPEVPVLK